MEVFPVVVGWMIKEEIEVRPRLILDADFRVLLWRGEGRGRTILTTCFRSVYMPVLPVISP